MNLAIIFAAFIFLIGALAPLFDWDLHKFNYLGWGLFCFALGTFGPTLLDLATSSLAAVLVAADSTNDLTKLILSYGVTPIVLIGMSTAGIVWFKPSVDQLLHDLDAVTKKLDERDALLRDIIVPAVTESNQLLKEVAIQLARRRSA